MKNKILLFGLSKFMLFSVLFYLAMRYEHPEGIRLQSFFLVYGLVVIVLATRLNYVIKHKVNSTDFNSKQIIYQLSFVLDIILIYLLESFSRYTVNQFIHIIYILVIVEIILFAERRFSIVLAISTTLISLNKFLLRAPNQNGWLVLSDVLFSVFLFATVILSVSYARYYYEAQEKKSKLYQKLEALSLVEERNRISRNIHDSLGHELTATIMQMEMATKLMDKDELGAKRYIEEAKVSARKGMDSIRMVLEELTNYDDHYRLENLKELVETFGTRTESEIEYDFVSSFDDYRRLVREVVYRVVQESMTNAIRHGQASMIKVVMNEEKGGLAFSIEDNGIGTDYIHKGYGLKGMEERIESLKGHIVFVNEAGFSVKAWVSSGGMDD